MKVRQRQVNAALRRVEWAKIRLEYHGQSPRALYWAKRELTEALVFLDRATPKEDDVDRLDAAAQEASDLLYAADQIRMDEPFDYGQD